MSCSYETFDDYLAFACMSCFDRDFSLVVCDPCFVLDCDGFYCGDD